MKTSIFRMNKYSFKAKIQKISQLKFCLYSETVTSELLHYSSMPLSNDRSFQKLSCPYLKVSLLEWEMEIRLKPICVELGKLTLMVTDVQQYYPAFVSVNSSFKNDHLEMECFKMGFFVKPQRAPVQIREKPFCQPFYSTE